jgi:hypothetical protein
MPQATTKVVFTSPYHQGTFTLIKHKYHGTGTAHPLHCIDRFLCRSGCKTTIYDTE